MPAHQGKGQPEGQALVYGRSGSPYATRKGRVVGERPCQLEACGGTRLAVRWPNGHLTWPCTKGMTHNGKAWRIL
jgi:hypothetical protein